MGRDASWAEIYQRWRLAPLRPHREPTPGDLQAVQRTACRLFGTARAEEARRKFAASEWATRPALPARLPPPASSREPYRFRFHPEGEHPYYEAPAWTWYEDDEDYWYEEHLYQLHWRKRKRDGRHIDASVAVAQVHLERDSSDDESQSEDRDQDEPG